MTYISFNKPVLAGSEFDYISEVLKEAKLSGNGKMTKNCHEFFKREFSFDSCLLTSSCTDALEMTSILAEIKEGDEVILPSYTFVSTANAFALRGAKLVFVDSRKDHPGIDEEQIEALITSKTKAVIPVHYAGVACDMDKILTLAKKHSLFVIEDAAQAIDSYYKGKPLGGIGDFGTFSFHETKNIISGEGGMLTINNEKFSGRAEIIWEKGTNRSAFWRGEVDKYGWVDLGSSFLPSELTAAFLFAQLNELNQIQSKRMTVWEKYNSAFQAIKEKVTLPFIPYYASNNAHMYYLVCDSLEERTQLLKHLADQNINAVFHYLSLHSSPYFERKHDGRVLHQSDRYTDCLVRLPLHLGLTDEDVDRVTAATLNFFK